MVGCSVFLTKTSFLFSNKHRKESMYHFKHGLTDPRSLKLPFSMAISKSLELRNIRAHDHRTFGCIFWIRSGGRGGRSSGIFRSFEEFELGVCCNRMLGFGAVPYFNWIFKQQKAFRSSPFPRRLQFQLAHAFWVRMCVSNYWIFRF